MKEKIIYTDDYALIVSDEEIKKDNLICWIYIKNIFG